MSFLQAGSNQKRVFANISWCDDHSRACIFLIAVSLLHQTCTSLSGPAYYEHGYIASPNYPVKYYMGADCYWRISVQRRQTIKLYIVDFELDVKRRGTCHDYMEITAEERTYFKDCGALGREELEIESHNAVVHFHTAPNSLAQRGFLLYFEGK